MRCGRRTCPRIYVCNLLQQPGETEGYRASDHVARIYRPRRRRPGRHGPRQPQPGRARDAGAGRPRRPAPARRAAWSAPAWPASGSTTPTGWPGRWCGWRGGDGRGVECRWAFGEVVRRELTERPPATVLLRRRSCAGSSATPARSQLSGRERRGAGRARRRRRGAAGLPARCASCGGDGQIVSFREPRFAAPRRACCCACTATAACSCCTRWACFDGARAAGPSRPRRLLQRALLPGAYLRGAFVAAGSVSAPRARRPSRDPRTAEPEAAELVRRGGRGGRARAARRPRAAATPSPTPRASETIRELLAHMGAHDAVLRSRRPR